MERRGHKSHRHCTLYPNGASPRAVLTPSLCEVGGQANKDRSRHGVRTPRAGSCYSTCAGDNILGSRARHRTVPLSGYTTGLMPCCCREGRGPRPLEGSAEGFLVLSCGFAFGCYTRTRNVISLIFGRYATRFLMVKQERPQPAQRQPQRRLRRRQGR